MNELQIKEMTTAHVEAVAHLAYKLWPESALNELRDEFEYMLDSEKDIVFIAVLQGTPVGFIHVALRVDYVEGSSSSPVGFIEGIYVDEPYRSQGIGKLLVQRAEQWSKDKGCTEFASDALLDNHSSHAFHRHVGFEEAGRIVAFIKRIK